ncbi:MAG: hypothetical protein ACREX0_08945 [Noviherbaspirillum sp.]
MENQDLRFVAHIDILGMSAIVEKDADQAWSRLSALVAVRDKVGNYEIEFLQSNERVVVSDTIRAITVSDTIILFTQGASDTELRCMIIAVTEILHKAICRCVPIRAGLAFGRFFFNLDQSMYAGPALIEAYRVGESAKWLGITLAESVHEKAKGLGMKSGSSSVIVEWHVPVKTGTEKRFVVNWPAVVAHDLTINPPVTVPQFYQGFESTFGPFEQLAAEVQAKYENTVKFINEQLAAHASSNQAINTDNKKHCSFVALLFAAGYGER